MNNRLVAELVAEAFGTFVLIAFGNGVVAMVNLFGHGVPNEIVNGGFTNITEGFRVERTGGNLYLAPTAAGPVVPRP